jgi:hypothetical protein
MLRSLLLFAFGISLAWNANAQTIIDCGSGRYDSELFPDVTVQSDVIYGSNVDANGQTLQLKMDIYQPDGDTAAYRPAIVMVHGGSFIAGSKLDNDVVEICTRFAKRGYVCASIDYRIGIPFPIAEANAVRAVYRAVQDMKAAVRFFRQDAATTNTYRIDPDIIFGGGSSAGAFTALHLAYLDDPAELPSQIDTVALGGMEGNSGNPGYSSEIKAVVNLCGALGNKTWIHPGDEPLCSMHGTVDNTVPYGTDMIYLAGIFPIMIVDGSYPVAEQANLVGLDNTMYTYFGADHVPYAIDAAYMDTTIRFVSNFLYRQLGCTPADPEPLANTFPTTGVQDLQKADWSIFPNPAAGRFQWQNLPAEAASFRLVDPQGRVVLNSREFRDRAVDLSGLPAGMYFIRLMNEKEQEIGQKVLILLGK